MALWVRSQDNSILRKVNESVSLSPSGLNILVDGYVMGLYKSKERAMEVLNEIVDLMIVNISRTGSYDELDLAIKNEILGRMNRIFVMPEK